MKLSHITVRALLVAAGSLLLGFGSANAQITTYTTGDLVLYFQNPTGTTGSTQTVMVSLGAPQTYRDSTTSGPILITGLGTTLTNAFGANWYEEQSLHMGVAANRGTANTNISHVSLDPSRTIYIGDPRTAVGSVGSANSAGYSVDTASMGTGATNINGQNGIMTNGGASPQTIGTASSLVDNQNPFTNIATFQQGTAFGLFPGGVQYQFGTGSFGTFGAAGQVEGALDLYRIQSRSDSVGQYGFGNTALNGNGQYMGTITIDQDGDVYFTAVPEPTSIALVGLGAAALLARRRRRNS